MSTYTATVTWRSESPEIFATKKYSRGHTWTFDGGTEVPASSSPHAVRVPYSVEAAVDPEEALVASASSCHMLTFLWLASKAGFNVASYTDNPVGEMTKDADGKEFISKITLKPLIEWVGDTTPTGDQIAELHHHAHTECPIANSIKAEIVVEQ